MKIIEMLDCGIFPPKVMFVMGFSKEELIDELTKQECHDWITCIEKGNLIYPSETTLGVAMFRRVSGHKFPDGSTNKEFFFLILREFDFSDYHMVALAHECVHLCQFILPDLLERDREIEAEAYLHSHLMSQVLKVLRNENSKPYDISHELPS